MSFCSCTAGAPAGQVGFTVDGTLLYTVAGSYTVAQIVTAENLNQAITGLKNIVTNVNNVGATAITINGGEAFASTYGPF